MSFFDTTDLKSLRRQYELLLTPFLPPSPSPTTTSPHLPSDPIPNPNVLEKVANAIKRLELDYKGTWEVVDILVDLGDGTVIRSSDGGGRGGEGNGEEEREKRKEEVLRDVFNSRLFPPLDVPLPTLDSEETRKEGQGREENKMGGKGITYASIRDFFTSFLPSPISPTLLPPPIIIPIESIVKVETKKESKQRRRRTLTALRSFSSPPPLLSTYSHFRGTSILSNPLSRRTGEGSDEDDEDWDSGSVIFPSSLIPTSLVRGEKMILTTEGMPDLLKKVREVHERCEECLVRLKGLTI